MLTSGTAAACAVSIYKSKEELHSSLFLTCDLLCTYSDLSAFGPSSMEDLSSKNVLIVGAGVAGLSTSLHLARAGVPVTVLDYQPYNVNGYSPSKGCDAASADVNKIFRASCAYMSFLPHIC